MTSPKPYVFSTCLAEALEILKTRYPNRTICVHEAQWHHAHLSDDVHTFQVTVFDGREIPGTQRPYIYQYEGKVLADLIAEAVPKIDLGMSMSVPQEEEESTNASSR